MTGEIYKFRDKEFEIDYEVVRSKKRRRSIALTLSDAHLLRVSVPYRAPQSEIDAILKERAQWLVTRVKRAQERRSKIVLPCIAPDGFVFYMGHKCLLQVCFDNKTAGLCTLRKGRFEISLSTNLSDAEVIDELSTSLRLWLKKRARTIFRRRLDLWASRLKLTYRAFEVSRPSQRWGSCSADNFIRLNWQLMMAPLAQIDYVTVHELCHIKHKNHGILFWRKVEKFMPDYQLHRKKLRENAKAYEI